MIGSIEGEEFQHAFEPPKKKQKPNGTLPNQEAARELRTP